jgi:hypothetical protein
MPAADDLVCDGGRGPGPGDHLDRVSSGFKAVHRHLLEATGDGVTRVRSEESMARPLLVLLYSSAKLQAGLEAWLSGLKTAAERP